jgi:hypothetical protein
MQVEKRQKAEGKWIVQFRCGIAYQLSAEKQRSREADKQGIGKKIYF